MTGDESQSNHRTPPRISGTAVYVAAGRAVGAREPDPSARNPDYLAEKLLGDASDLELDHPAIRGLGLSYAEALEDFEVAGNVRMMTVRTRFVDETLERATARGATQVVILGAGLDTRAYRMQETLARTHVFEVDTPETQTFKKHRVREAIGARPANLTYVALDVGLEDLPSALARHGYETSRRTFFILEGLTMYLTEEAVRETLRFIAKHPPGSGVVFDFFPRELVDMLGRVDMKSLAPTVRPLIQRFLELIRHEPWLFGIPVGREREFLGEVGLEVRELLTIGGEESVQRYLTRADGTQVGGEATAEMMARVAAESGTASGGQHMSPDAMREWQRSMAHQLVEALVS